MWQDQRMQPQSLKRRIGSCSSEPGPLIPCKVSKVVGGSHSSRQLIVQPDGTLGRGSEVLKEKSRGQGREDRPVSEKRVEQRKCHWGDRLAELRVA